MVFTNTAISCETQLINTIHDFVSTMNNREQVDAIMLDMSKAFDIIPHNRLCSKLAQYGILGAVMIKLVCHQNQPPRSILVAKTGPPMKM